MSKQPKPAVPVFGPVTESARRLYVFIGPSDNGHGTARLRMSTLRARRFVTIGPHLPRDFYADSMFVLDRRHLWFTVFPAGGGRERLYRTSDGGISWHWNPVPSHVLAGGSTDALWFTDPDHGWLTDIEPTAPDAMLFVTADGGRHWRVVADSDRRAGTRLLPSIGPVQFQPDGSTAWDAAPAGWFSPALDVTRNSGATWQTALTARNRAFATPGVFGNEVMEPVSWCARRTCRARLFVSGDDGAHWVREPAVVLGAVLDADHSVPDGHVVATAVPNADDAWVTARTAGRRLVVTSTCDQGKRWHAATAPDLRVEFGPEISAIDCRHALLHARDLRGVDHLYVTSDGGTTWRSIDQRVSR